MAWVFPNRPQSAASVDQQLGRPPEVCTAATYPPQFGLVCDLADKNELASLDRPQVSED